MQQIYRKPANLRAVSFNGSNNFNRKPIKLKDKVTRWRGMASDANISDKARLRLEWMIYYETDGNQDAYKTASHFGIAAKTFYKWYKRFDQGKIHKLEDQSRCPHNYRKWEVTLEEENRIKKLRMKHMHYGKKKLKVLYEWEYSEEISTWKIERVIRKHQLYPDKKKRDKIAAKRKGERKQRITELNKKKESLFLFQIDTIVIYWGNLKRYIITAVDYHSKVGYARMYSTKSSRSAKDFLYRLHYLIDEEIANIQTDNGSEFLGEFTEALDELEITRWFSRVKTPKDNCYVERFNETLEYEWLYDNNFTPNLEEFNRAITEWLIEYNFRRPHQSLDYVVPFEYYLKSRDNYPPDLLPMYSASTVYWRKE